MSLYTEKYIHSNDSTELHIYGNVVKRVEALAKKGKHTTFYQYPMFEWAQVIPIMYAMTQN